MQSYIESYNRYLEYSQNSVHTYSQDSQLQPLMHTLPTTTISNQTNLNGTSTHLSAFRNSYLTRSIEDDSNDQIKSAFKPVKPRISIYPIPTISSEIQNINFDTSMYTSTANSSNTHETLPDSIYTSSYESYNHITNSATLENINTETNSLNWSTKYEKTPNETNFRMAYKYVADITGRVVAVYHWDTLLPVLPEKNSVSSLPTRQKGPRIQRRQELKTLHNQITQFNDNSVPIIIDLTSEQEQTDKLDVIDKSNGTNQKLIKRKQLLPPKKQITSLSKSNRWHKQIRTYNGFRLFVRRNQSYAKERSNKSANETIINNVLVKWWNKASAKEKEHYAQAAEAIIEKQPRSMSAVAIEKIQNDCTVISDQLNTIPKQECDKSLNQLPIDIVYEKKTTHCTNTNAIAEKDSFDDGAKSLNRENNLYLPNDYYDNSNSLLRASLSSMNKFIQMG